VGYRMRKNFEKAPAPKGYIASGAKAEMAVETE
jgi:hypothetical protein